MSDKVEQTSIVDALKWYDENSRLERTARIEWASSIYQSPGIVEGEIVPLKLMEEARVCFVNGQFMACVLCATSVIEHLLVDELVAKRLIGGKPTLGSSIGEARTERLFSAEVLGRMDELNNLRNPIAHRRDSHDASTLASRYRNHQVHPDTLLENDARFALEVMYEFFQLVLKSDTCPIS